MFPFYISPVTFYLGYCSLVSFHFPPASPVYSAHATQPTNRTVYRSGPGDGRADRQRPGHGTPGSLCQYHPRHHLDLPVEGALEQDQEALLLIKTGYGSWQLLQERIRELHPYELPEIIAVPIDSGQTDYIKWITSCLK